MRLTKLEINGFKSFARKTEIEFDKGVTAIIGPNGSGKSNIADSVRWVLGEQSAKALRGSKMEDVIFNGTEQKKPQAYCEVSLTFDNADGRLPVDFSEVNVMRRVYRSGESEYFINRAPCRLRDIGELFRDTGIGKEGYSIIGQGKVEEILSNKSNDRRAAFEEAAGVMRYRVRKEEAEHKLESTKKNLLRLNDILDELERQVGPLEEQSATAREYLKLRDELKDIEINIFLYQYDKLTQKLKSLADTNTELDEACEESTAIEVSLAADCTREEELERSLGSAISELQAKLLALSSGVEAKSGEAKVIEERAANMLSDKERIETQMRENERKHAEAREALDNSSNATGVSDEKYDEMKRTLDEAEKRASDIADETEAKEALIEKQKNEMIEAMNRLSDAKSKLTRLETIRTTFVQRLEGLSGDEEKARAEGEKLAAELSDAQTEFDAIKREYDELQSGRTAAISRLNEANLARNRLNDEVRALEQRREAEKSRLKVLEEMKRANEGYYQSVRNVLRDADRDTSLGRCIEGVVASLMRVPQEYETAIEMALGAALQNIVTPTEQEAKRVIEYLRKMNYGRATMLPITTVRSRLLDQREREMCRVDGFIGVASELVSFDAKYAGVMENLLGRTVIVRDIDAGIEINRRAHSSFKIATLKGDIMNPGGSMTGGSTQKKEFSLVGREREINDLRTRIDKAMEVFREKEREAETLDGKVKLANSEVEDFTQKLHAKDVTIATHREKLDIIKKYVEENRAAQDNVELLRSQINDNIENIDEQCREAENDRSGIESGHYASQEDIRRSQEELQELRRHQAKTGDEVTEIKVSLMAMEKERAAAEAERRRVEREAEALERSLEGDRRTVCELEGKIAELKESLASLGENVNVERQEVDALTDRLHEMEEEKARHLRAYDEMRERRETVTSEINDLRERKHRNEIAYSKTEMELTGMQDRIWADYELTYENANALRKPIAVTASHLRIDELKKAIRGLGDVNISSIEEYKSVKERFDTMSAQCADLVKAEADLQTLIAELVTTMEAEFKKQFTLIQENFSVVFAQLFGGGKAELVLTDANDILNCDIDIIAQPPGKKLQLLSLLSGGERALTAIALLFAILKLKPTAFCILDEIESSLDEVNVSNFAEFVRDYSDDTQFILITHRKGSMEVCNALYGVAMEERGVSKIVSARFNETA